MSKGGDWGNFFQDLTKSGIKTAVDYHIADEARDNHLTVPEDNMFNALPSNNTQAINPSQNNTGQPLKVFYKPDGTLNVPLVAGAAVIAVLLLRGG